LPLPPLPEPASTVPPRERTFHLMVRDGDVASASNYEAVPGKLRAIGRWVQVYVDRSDLDVVDQELLDDLVATFDDRVLPVAAHNFGQARDVDGDGRFTVFLSNRLTRLAGGRHAVDGFVRGADFDLSLAGPFSNHADMMYVSAALQPGPHFRTVVAHEYTHAVTFGAKGFADHAARFHGPEEEGWLDEAIAHLGEDLHGFSRSNIDYRVSAYLSQPERYRLVVEDYYAAELFRSHGNRGSTYLFLRWCADRFGPGLIPALVRSKRVGIANLEAATGCSFADLYRSWTIALFLTGLDPSLGTAPGYRSLDLRARLDDWALAGPRTVPLVPAGPPVVWESAATASRFLLVEASPTGAAEVEIVAPPDCSLQVTAVPLPDDLPRLRVEVRAVACDGGQPGMQVCVAEANGTPVRLSALSWEPLVPGPDPHSAPFRRGDICGPALAESFDATSLAAYGYLESKPIATPPAIDGMSPLVFKLVGTDARGRRIAAWAEVTPTPPERSR
jgi:hypothetical protein